VFEESLLLFTLDLLDANVPLPFNDDSAGVSVSHLVQALSAFKVAN
jgi:hypothetical protein